MQDEALRTLKCTEHLIRRYFIETVHFSQFKNLYQMLVLLAAWLLAVCSVSLEWEGFTAFTAGFYTVAIYVTQRT